MNMQSKLHLPETCYIPELKLHPVPSFSSDKIFQMNEKFPSVFCHFLFITLIRNLMELHSTRKGILFITLIN